MLFQFWQFGLTYKIIASIEFSIIRFFFFRLLWSTSGQAPPKNQYGTKILIKFTNTQSRNFEQEYNKTDRTIYKAPLKLNIQSTNWPKGHFSYSTKPSCIFNNIIFIGKKNYCLVKEHLKNINFLILLIGKNCGGNECLLCCEIVFLKFLVSFFGQMTIRKVQWTDKLQNDAI